MTGVALLLIAAALVATAVIFGTDVFAAIAPRPPSPAWMTAP